MSGCSQSGTNHMFDSLDRRSLGLSTLPRFAPSSPHHSIAHFLNSACLYFFPCFLCLLLKRCKRVFPSLICSPLIAFSSGNKDRRKKGREVKEEEWREGVSVGADHRLEGSERDRLRELERLQPCTVSHCHTHQDSALSHQSFQGQAKGRRKANPKERTRLIAAASLGHKSTGCLRHRPNPPWDQRKQQKRR